MIAPYRGPIIDAHHHLWDVTLGRHPWLTEAGQHIKALGDIAFLRQNYLVSDFLTDAEGQNILGSVYIEAVWDRSRSPTEEIVWLATQQRPSGIAARAIAWAPLRDPDLGNVLQQLLHYPVAGIRETVRWHPDPAKSWAPRNLMSDSAWRAGVARLSAHNLLLELLMNPYQADHVARLAAELPNQIFVVNHCGTPVDRDESGIARWRAGLSAMARQPNVLIKISNQVGYAADPASQDAVTAVVRTVLDAFGPGRAMFGTDYPVQRRTASYAMCCDSMRVAVSDLSHDEQRALFHDNAARVYGFPSS